MATSSKVQFNLETLKEQALKSVQERIQNAIDDVTMYDGPDAYNALMVEWRKDQEERVSHLFSKLGGKDLSDEELAQFRIATPPTDNFTRERRNAERKLRDLQDLESKIRAKASSLVADEGGNITLTKTQLSEFFGL